MGFHRLSIMGLTPEGMQPFEMAGWKVICNGEIYGFEKIRAELESMGYTFRSGSDCEILLPMFFEYGTDMFRMLDAEFVCVLYNEDTGEYIAARDPIGIRPLYYGYDKEGNIAFASEPKSLIGITGRIMPFPPGHYWKNGGFIRYRDVTEVDGYISDDVDEIFRNIREKL
jgi:asparagine synthase (glutamine-hydrolysing)